VKRTLVTLALGVAVTSLEAQTTFPPPPPPTLSGPYFGASVGYAQAKNGCLGFLSGGGRACDDNDLEWGLLAGYQINRYFGAEAAYRDLGKVRATSASSSEFTHAAVWDLTAVGIVPIEERFSAYGKFGAYLATLDASARDIADHRNSGLTYGAGLQWDFRAGYGLRAQWQRYRNVGGGDTFGTNHYDVLGVALLYRLR